MAEIHVAHMVQHLRQGGIESLALEMQALGRSGFAQSIVSLEGERDAALAAWPRLRAQAGALHFMAKPAGKAVGLPLRLAKHLRQQKIEIVQTHHVGPLLYAGLAARLTGTRLVHVEHDAWHLNEPERRKLVRRLVGLTRPKLVAVSPVVAERVEAALERPCQVIGNAIDLERFCPGDKATARNALGLADWLERPLIVCAARLEPVKGVDILLQALAALPVETTLAVAGEGTERASLEAQACELGLTDRVRFLGRIDAMPELYRAGDVCALPSRNEGLPLSVLEAQASGCPVVATQVGGVPRAIDPVSGAIVPPDDPAALASALESVLASPKPEAARAYAAARFSFETMMAAYAKLWAPGT